MLSWGGDDTQRVQVVSPSIKLSTFELTRPKVYIVSMLNNLKFGCLLQKNSKLIYRPKAKNTVT